MLPKVACIGTGMGTNSGCSTGTSIPHGKNRLSMYIVQSAPYVEPKVSDDESSIWHIASGTFLRNKSIEKEYSTPKLCTKK
jgi:hypothetical protein